MPQDNLSASAAKGAGKGAHAGPHGAKSAKKIVQKGAHNIKHAVEEGAHSIQHVAEEGAHSIQHVAEEGAHNIQHAVEVGAHVLAEHPDAKLVSQDSWDADEDDTVGFGAIPNDATTDRGNGWGLESNLKDQMEEQAANKLEHAARDSRKANQESGSARRAMRAVVLHPAFDWVVLAWAHRQLSTN